MRKFFYPNKDCTIYEEFTTRQSGLDEILEVGKSASGSHAIRSLVQFDINEISESLANGTISTGSLFDMKLYLARADKVKLNQNIELYPVSCSWLEGQGYFYEEPYEELDGATWQRRFTGSLWTNSGSDYLTSPTASQTSSLPIGDFTFDVTSLILDWVSGSILNYGTLIRFPQVDEDDGSNEGRLYFFSRNTHTVFVPTIIAKWNNQTYSTGSYSSASLADLIVYPINMKSKYRVNEAVRIYLTARERAPLKTYSATFAEWSTKYLPQTSYYSIVDVQSQEEIIPFDDYSRISIDSTGIYFDFKVQKMYPLRWYKIKIKVIGSGGFEQIFDDRYEFMVTP